MRRLLATVVFVAAVAACGGSDAETATTTSSPARSTTTTDVEITRVSGTLVHRDSEGVDRAWSFTVLADGSFRLERGGTVSEVQAYDAKARRYEANGDDFARAHEGRAIGGPDYNAHDDVGYLLRLELGWHVASLARAKSSKVDETTALERASLGYRDTFQPNAVAGDGAPDEIVATVDRATWLPLVVEDRAGGKIVARSEVTKLSLGGQTGQESFSAGVEVPAERGPWRAMAAGDATPLTVGDVPPGYRLDTRVVASKPDPTGPEASNPVAGPAYAVGYRAGFGQLVVTMRPVGDDLDAWSDPFGGEGMFLKSSRRRLTAGAGDGAQAEIVIDPQTVPHLWVIAGDLVVTVSGPLSADELVAVAESLRLATTTP